MDQADRAYVTCRGKAYIRLSCGSIERADQSSQRALADQPWKEYTAEGGRMYWFNTETKQSSWEIPEVYKNALSQSQPARSIAPYASLSTITFLNTYIA